MVSGFKTRNPSLLGQKGCMGRNLGVRECSRPVFGARFRHQGEDLPKKHVIHVLSG